MNPKVSITVDSKNKAISSLIGIVSVGAKIDVEISGIVQSSVPDWGSNDDFTGPSLRFRVVDGMGRDLVRYQLRKKTETIPDVWTWDSTSNKFTASNVEFDTDVLRNAFRHVPYDETMEFGVIIDSIVDSAEYAVGKIKIRQWSAASTEDPTVLPDWRETLAKLEDDLGDFESAKTIAVNAATSASLSASSAASSASSAANSENSALSSANSAGVSAASASASAVTAASSAASAAEQVDKYPKIDETTNHWFVWEANLNPPGFKDTGIVAEGNDGSPATISVGSVTTGDPGSSVTVTNVGTSSDAVFNFSIPRGNPGVDGTSASASVVQTQSGATITCQTGNGTPTIATVTNGAPGVPASVVQVYAPDDLGENKWHYLRARRSIAGDQTSPLVLSLEQDSSARDVGYIVPQGGTSGQVLAKNSSTDYDVGWKAAGAGDVIGATMNGSPVTKGQDGILAFGTVLTDSSAFDASGSASASISAHLSDTSNQHVTVVDKTEWNAAKAHADISTGNPHGVTWDSLSGVKPSIPWKTSDLTNDGADGVNSFVSSGDFRLTNSRDPNQHASSHASGGSDSITPSSIGAMSATVTHLSGDVLANDAITSGTKCKITYDSKGLVTAGADLSEGDIPSLDASKVTSGAFSDARISSASAWNAKQPALPTSGAASDTYAINVSGNAATATTATNVTNHATHSSGDVANLDTLTCSGLKVVAEEPETYDANVIYFIKSSS